MTPYDERMKELGRKYAEFQKDCQKPCDCHAARCFPKLVEALQRIAHPGVPTLNMKSIAREALALAKAP